MTAHTSTTIHHVIGADGLVAISLREGDLRLRAIDGDAVTVQALDHSPLDGLSVERGDRSLAIRAGGDGHAAGRHATPDLLVELPAGANLVVETSSSDVVVEGLVGDQRYRSASGDLTMRGIGGNLTVEAMSGDIRITATGPGRYDLRTVSGDLHLETDAIASLQAATTSGDLEIAGRFDGSGPYAIETVSGDLELAPVGDIRVDLRTISGDLDSDLPGRVEEGGGRRSFVVGSGTPAIDVRTTSGDVRLVRDSRHPAGKPVLPAAAVTPPLPPRPPAAPMDDAAPAADADDLDVLRALERGDIDLDEARRRLAALDGSAASDDGDGEVDRG